MSTTYRLEQRSREGQILRAEWVDEDGVAYSLRRALHDVAHMRAISPNFEWRVSGADGELVDEIAALDATDPARIANRWLRAKIADDDSVKLRSGEEIATCLRLVADRLADLGPVVPTFLSLQLQATEFEPDDVARRATVEAIAARLGFAAEPHRLAGGVWHYSLRAARAVGAFTSMKAPEPDEAELVARAVLQPDTLPDVGPVDEQAAADAVDAAVQLHEARCPCGQPWALLISGNAKHGASCPPEAEAGETEDALGVPGLTVDEADDFMSGGAR